MLLETQQTLSKLSLCSYLYIDVLLMRKFKICVLHIG